MATISKSIKYPDCLVINCMHAAFPLDDKLKSGEYTLTPPVLPHDRETCIDYFPAVINRIGKHQFRWTGKVPRAGRYICARCERSESMVIDAIETFDGKSKK